MSAPLTPAAEARRRRCPSKRRYIRVFLKHLLKPLKMWFPVFIGVLAAPPVLLLLGNLTCWLVADIVPPNNPHYRHSGWYIDATHGSMGILGAMLFGVVFLFLANVHKKTVRELEGGWRR